MFSIKEAVKYGWNKTKANFWKVVGLMVIVAIPSFLISLLQNYMETITSDPLKVFLGILILVINLVSIILGIGLIKIFLRINEGENPSIKEIFNTQGVFWKYIGVTILYVLIITGGLILLVIPGIIWAIKYCFASIIVIDTKSGPITALKESANITYGKKWKIFAFYIVFSIIVFLGYIAIYIGSLVTIPIASFAWIYVYRELSKMKTPLVSTPSPQVA